MANNLKNPVLPALLQGQGLPEYKEINANEIQIHIPRLLRSLNNELSELEQALNKKLVSEETITWEDVMPPLHHINEQLRWSWGVVSHLNGVNNSSELREAHTAQQPEVVRFGNRIGQSKAIHSALIKLNKNPDQSLDQTQQRILNTELLSMKHRGVGLEGAIQQEFNSASERLAELATNFSNHVLDATQQWSLLLTESEQVDGLPPRALEILASAARDAGDLHENGQPANAEHGPWRVGLDLPRYIPFITYSSQRELRETIYKAHVSRASSAELNNQPLIEEILDLRLDQAKRLGYANWAELSLASKMADSVQSVECLLEELRSAAYPVAESELAELQKFANQHIESTKTKTARDDLPHDELKPWDVSFWAERLRQDRFNLNQENLRPWFPLPRVLEGLFNLCELLFNIRIEAADGEAPIWHDDVRFFRVLDQNGEALAAFYLDPFSRPSSKRGGAWMDECLIRSRGDDNQLVLPVAYLICNQTPPIGDKPSLMSFEEVETLFHEFGHGLQHMLTTINHPEAAGINNIEWDAVELPSQFMENWCLHRPTLMGMAKHWQTNEPLPEEEFQKLKSSRTFMAGSATLRQVHFALIDLRLHSQWNSAIGITPNQMRLELSPSTTIIHPIKEDNFLCAFSHIFCGGYAAGYYSYKWAEVLSADAFSAFEEAGLDLDEKLKETGARFRETVLSLGGSKPPSEVFVSFRGRPANTSALIRHSGLTLSEEQQPKAAIG